MKAKEFTYDVHFNDENDSNNKGFKYSFEDAKGYIDSYNGTNESYFKDYKGGSVSVVCNETDETVYEVEVLQEKRFNYFYNGVAIPKSQFIESVPSNWKSELDEYGEYSYGYYRAIER